jgi:hypothetical protein
MENKQSAVEWLIEQLTEVERKNWINNKILPISKNSLAKQIFNGIIEQAKEMEKEQIIDAYHCGRAFENKYPESLKTYNDSAEQYYNETYGK